MIRRLMLVNSALVALLVFLSWQLEKKIVQTKMRENALLLMKFPPVEVPGPTALSKVAALDATAYQDAVAKNLFSRDRNPIPVPDPPPPPPAPPPVPPFPVARGVMLWEGVPPTIVLSSKRGANDQRAYHPGEKFGEWTILGVDHEYLTLGWNGQEFKERLDELMDHTPINTVAQVAQSSPAPPQGGATAPKSAVTSVSEASAAKGQGADMGGDVRACVAGDNQPAGTIAEGHKKVVSQTPFGSVCRWEPVQ